MDATDNRLVRDVGEFGLIEFLTASLPAEARSQPDLALGIGDDAAVWQPTPGEAVVITTDSLIEGIHFRLDWTDWRSLGHKTLAVNISDLAAMGAKPRLAVITLGLRGDERLSDLRPLYEGMGELAKRHCMTIAGGDVVRSPLGLMLNVTALGETRDGRVLRRTGARPGDLVGVTGTIGAAAAGLELLQLDAKDARRNAETASTLIGAHLHPEPRPELGKALLEHGATAAMDLSDGLMGDLPKILHAGNVAALIDARRLPVAAAVRALFPDNWLDLALRGGEDYELLFTAPAARWQEIAAAIAGAGGAVNRIGETLARDRNEPPIHFIDLDGAPHSLREGAFDHFADSRAN